jgi:hypothetical protein
VTPKIPTEPEAEPEVACLRRPFRALAADPSAQGTRLDGYAQGLGRANFLSQTTPPGHPAGSARQRPRGKMARGSSCTGALTWVETG